MDPSPSPYERFESVARRMPSAPAVDLGDRVVTYGEMVELVLYACDHLAALELPSQSRIGLEATSELPTYVAYLSILRLGHSVVPLRPDNPASFRLPTSLPWTLHARFWRRRASSQKTLTFFCVSRAGCRNG